jgi:signal transduction histidine kinase
MKLKTNLFLQFIVVGIIPIIILFVIVFINSRQDFNQRISESIQAIADIQQEHLNTILDEYVDSVKLITSRTQLRIDFEEYSNAGSQDRLTNMGKILNQAVGAGSEIEAIALYDINGAIITNTKNINVVDQLDEGIINKARTVNFVGSVFRDQQNQIKVRVYGPLLNQQGRPMGIAKIIADASSILLITDDYTGLGETGEIILVQKTGQTDALVINPLRFDTTASLQKVIFGNNTSKPEIIALNKEEVFLNGSAFDYRGKEVVAVTKYIDSVEWGLIVKMDASEVSSYANQNIFFFAPTFIITLLFILFLALILSDRITKPILGIATQADGISKGSFDMNFETKSTVYEVSQLSNAISNMSGELKELYADLEKKVQRRTEKIQFEKAKADAILSDIGEGLMLISTKGRIEYLNKSGYEILNIKINTFSRRDLGDQIKILSFEEKKDLSDHLLSQFNTSQSVKRKILDDRYYIRSSKKNIIPAFVTISDYFVNKKRVGFIIIFRDITKELELDKVKSEFVSLASHQLRTPLSVIRWFSELLAGEDAGSLNEKQKKFVDNIQKNNLRMLELVNALLNVTRIEANSFIINPVTVYVSESVQRVVNSFEKQITDKGLLVKQEIQEGLSLKVDENLFRVILENLISNAIKYSYENGRIDIHAHRENGIVEITVRDYGLGIPRAQQGRIFEKMFRADNAFAHDTDGNGLGLYIIKGIINQMGGEIGFTSKEGEGTSFSIKMSEKSIQKKDGNKKLYERRN